MKKTRITCFILLIVISKLFSQEDSTQKLLENKYKHFDQNNNINNNYFNSKRINNEFYTYKFKSEINLDSIIVTANKFPQKQSTTGKVVTVINKEQLVLNYGKSISEILTEQVGLQIGGAFGAAGTIQSVYTRGASSGRTLILIDGVPIYDPAQNNLFDLNLLNLQNIERIEILKGAQSTLYGSEAVAGVINIITTKPTIDKHFYFQTNLNTGSFNTQKSGVEWGGQFGRFSFVVQNDAINSDGFSFARDTIGNQNFANNGYDGNNHNLTMQYKLTPQLTIKNYYRKSYYKTNIDAGAFTDEKDNTSSNKNFVSGIGLDFKNDKSSFNFNYQYSENTVNFKNDSVQIISPYSYFSKDDYSSKFQFAEFYTTIQLSKNIKLLHGADYRFNSMNNQYLSLSSFGPYSSNLNDTSISQSSIYTSIFWTDNTQKWNIDLGGRLNVHSNYGSNYTYTFNPSFNINKEFRVFGSLSTAFKTPSLYQLFSSYGDVNLKPEQSISKEIGFSQTNKIMSNRIVYFDRIIEDGIDYSFNKNKYFNFAKQVVNGIELESNIQLSKDIKLQFNYTYLSANETRQIAQSFNPLTFETMYKDTTYQYSLKRPTHNFNLNIGFAITKKLFVSVSEKYVSNRYDIGNKTDILLYDYMLLNAHIQFSFSKTFRVYLDCRNLTNKQFYETYGYNNAPRSVTFGLMYKL